MLITYIIIYILTAALFMSTLIKWMTDQCSSIVFYFTLVGCLITVSSMLYMPWNAVILLLTFLIPIIVDYLNYRVSQNMKMADYKTCFRLIKRNSTNAAAHAKLGNLLEKDKKYKEAIDAYKKSLEGDPTQKDIDRKYQYLVELFALKESGQLRCPKCLTIVPIEYGKCWKCDKTFDRKQYLLSMIKKKGLAGIISLTISGALLGATIFFLIATINRIFTTSMSFSLTLTMTVISCVVSYLIYYKK